MSKIPYKRQYLCDHAMHIFYGHIVVWLTELAGNFLGKMNFLPKRWSEFKKIGLFGEHWM